MRAMCLDRGQAVFEEMKESAGWVQNDRLKEDWIRMEHVKDRNADISANGAGAAMETAQSRELTSAKEEGELKRLCAMVRAGMEGGMESGGLEGIEALLCEAMENFPDSPVPHNLFGILLERERKHAQAMKQFRVAYALDPSYEPARHNLEVFGGVAPLQNTAYESGDCHKRKKGFLRRLSMVTVRTAHLLDQKSRSRSIGGPSDVKINTKTGL